MKKTKTTNQKLEQTHWCTSSNNTNIKKNDKCINLIIDQFMNQQDTLRVINDQIQNLKLRINGISNETVVEQKVNDLLEIKEDYGYITNLSNIQNNIEMYISNIEESLEEIQHIL